MIGPTLVVLALVVVPGSGAALAFAQPGEIPLATRFALVFGFGYAVAAGLATLLALTHVLSRDSFAVALVVVTAAIWALVSWRSSFRAHAAALAAEARRTPFSLGAGLLLVLAVAASRPFYPPELTLAIRSAWRYWADGLEVAAAGHFPATTHQWGFEFPATVSKAV